MDDKTEGIGFSLFLQLPHRLQMIVHHVGYLRGFAIIVVLKFDLLLQNRLTHFSPVSYFSTP